MNNYLLQVKVKQRLNKIASGDYDNLEAWQILEAFNKVQLEWVRDQLGGNNIRKEGDEQSKRRIDDLQILLITAPLEGTNKQLYFESLSLPDNYMAFKKVSANASHCDCPGTRILHIDLAEEGNADNYLHDNNTCPDWQWAETFCTLSANKVKIYTAGKFTITTASLTYYRFPKDILISGVVDPSSGDLTFTDRSCEFKNDIAELLVDLCASHLAGDIENFNQAMRNKQNSESHN